MTETSEQIETDKESKSLGETEVSLWLKKIKKQLEAEKDWREDARNAEKIYQGEDNASIYFNILHSNTETLTPALYNSQPVPDVRRRWDSSDVIAKQVVDVSERLLIFSLDQYDFDDVAECLVKDAYVAGRGVTRLRYEPTVQDTTITDQHCQMEHVPWDKFIPGPARSWARMPWVAFEHSLSRDELVKLNPEKGKEIGLDAKENDKDDKDEENGVFKAAKVYEIWDKESGRVIFIAENEKDFPLKIIQDPIGISDFFPCPKPLQPISKLRSLVPVCPYEIYKDLVEELNKVTKRINRLIGQLKVRGLVDASISKDFEQMIDCGDGEYQPAQNATAFAQGSGGIEQAIAHWPMEPTIAALAQLYAQREQIKQVIYEVTGLSDILRGSSDARETLGAQQIKTQWGSLRIQNLQNAVAKWAREVFRKKTDLFSKHYDEEVISRITALPSNEEQAAVWPQVMQMFKSEMMSFRIDVETDSTIRADMVRSQETMNQFLQSTGQFASAMGGIIQVKPELMPVIIEIYTAFARKFKLGKQAEDALDQLQTQATEQEQQQEQPNPEQEQAAREAQQEQQRFEMEMQINQQRMQADAHKMKIEQQRAQIDLQNKQADAQIKQLELSIKQQLGELDIMIKQADLSAKEQAAAIAAETKITDLNLKRQNG